MAAMVMFQGVLRSLMVGGHDFDGQVYHIALSNVAPVAATDTLIGNITQITAGTGYTAGGSQSAYVSSNQSAGLCTIIFGDVIFTASGGNMGPFRYAVFYRLLTGGLVGYWDYGVTYTLTDGQSFTVDLSAANGILKMS